MMLRTTYCVCMQTTGAFVSQNCEQVNLLYPMIDEAVGGIESLLERYGGGLGYDSKKTTLNGSVTCVNPIVQYEPQREDLIDKLYCAFHQVRHSLNRSVDFTSIIPEIVYYLKQIRVQHPCPPCDLCKNI